jgi:hypothetical protein
MYNSFIRSSKRKIPGKTPARDKRNVRRVIAALVLACPVLVNAAVPHIFSNGQPADANKVNVNFADLDGRLATLEVLGLPQVGVDCDSDREALQKAIDAAPHSGQEITVTGICNSISIFSKNNLVITGPATVRGSNTEDTLNINLSQGVFINGITVDANNMGPSAVWVGASAVVFTDLTTRNSAGDASMGISTNGLAIFGGNTYINKPTGPVDPNDPSAPLALEMDERASLLVEGSAVINGEVDMSDFSYFDQDSEGNPANELDLNGKITIGPASRMEAENGSLSGPMEISGGSFLARPGGGQTLSYNGNLTVVRSSLFLDTTSGGTINLSGNRMIAQLGSLISAEGTNITLSHNEVTVSFNSQLFLQAGALAGSVNQFFFSTFSSFYSETFIDFSKVSCNVIGGPSDSVWAFQESGSGQPDLCTIIPPDPNAP